MRSWKLLLFMLALLGGAAGLSPSKAAPLAVPIAAAQADAAPLVQTARWHGRRHWHRHHGWRHHRWHHRHRWHRHHWRRHHHHRRLRFY